MRWATYLSQSTGALRPGLLVEGRLHAVDAADRLVDLLGDDGERLFAAGQRALADPAEVVDLAQARLAAPIPSPPSIRDFMAFEGHVATSYQAMGSGIDPGWYDAPVFYFSNSAAVHGPYDDVAVPPGSRRFDYELEVAAVIGRQAADVSPEDAESCIAGYTVFCDWSARDLQMTEMKQGLGPAKGKDSANSLGPFLVTPDELAAHRTEKGFALAMTASVNGQLYSSGSLADLFWTFPQMIAYASRGTVVRPGDVIGSGTVGTGCILELSLVHGAERYPWLRPGDEVSLEVEELGAIRSRVVPGREPIALR